MRLGLGRRRQEAAATLCVEPWRSTGGGVAAGWVAPGTDGGVAVGWVDPATDGGVAA